MMMYSFFIFLFVLVAAVTRFLRTLKYRSLWCGPTLPCFEYPTLADKNIFFKRLKVLGTSHIGVYYSKEISYHRPWIVYCHGMMTNCESDLSVFEQLAAEYNVVAWDYRGFGRSTGSADEIVTMYDLHYVISWLETTYKIDTPPNVILLGRSLGSNVILSYIQNRQILPQKIILCHPFYSLVDVFKGWGLPSTLAYVVGSMNTKEALKHYLETDTQRAALIIGTSEDSVTPWQCAVDEVHQIENSEQITLKDVGGDHFKVPPQMWREIKDFLL